MVCRSVAVLAATLSLGISGAQAAGAETHADHRAAGAAIGETAFPTSCSPEAQRSFNQAVWMLHSFWYEESLKAFSKVAEAEPSCAMAEWGVAMSSWYPLWFPPTPTMLKTGAAAVAKGMAAGPPTDRERRYLSAIGAFFENADTVDHRTRALAYEKAMDELRTAYPEDREAAIFYALALNATWPPTDKSYGNLKKAAAILEPIWLEQPRHPGIVHYLIHSYDTPALATAGLDAARRYAAIAPAVPHAQHMPSHIFTRLGLWRESIASNLVAYEVASTHAAQAFGPGGYDQETVHPLDYLAYAYLQTAQDNAARGVVDKIAALQKGPPATLPMAYAVAAIPARYVLERRDWKSAASLEPVLAEFPWDRFPWASAITSFARALGAAHIGDTAIAEREIAAMEAMRNKLVEAKNEYWAAQVEVQRLGAASALAQARGEGGRAVELARSAAELEQSMDKHPATPGAVLPARELLGDLLLDQGDAAGALASYRAVLQTEPNRFRSVLGVARAAEKSGDTAAATAAYGNLVGLAMEADAARPELAEARRFLGN